MKSGKTQQALDACVQLLHVGKVHECQKNLIAFDKLAPTKLANREKLQLANLYRRCGHFSRALKVLHPIFHPTEILETRARPTAEESIEYAASLLQVGIRKEAQMLLEKLDPQLFPVSLMYRAFIAFSRWDSHQAMPLLKDYLRSTKLSEHERLVGQLNYLAAKAAVFSNGEVIAELKSFMNPCEKLGKLRLKANATEILAQVYISVNETKEALRLLNSISITNTSPNEFLFVKKWQWV